MRIAGVSVGAGGKRFAGQTEHWRTKERPIYSRASFFSIYRTTASTATSTFVLVLRVNTSTCPSASFLPTLMR